MAYGMMGGIVVGTVLALFLPALYVAWFRIKQPDTHELAATPGR
jgi:multidrug efflux pump